MWNQPTFSEIKCVTNGYSQNFTWNPVYGILLFASVRLKAERDCQLQKWLPCDLLVCKLNSCNLCKQKGGCMTEFTLVGYLHLIVHDITNKRNNMNICNVFSQFLYWLDQNLSCFFSHHLKSFVLNNFGEFSSEFSSSILGEKFFIKFDFSLEPTLN